MLNFCSSSLADGPAPRPQHLMYHVRQCTHSLYLITGSHYSPLLDMLLTCDRLATGTRLSLSSGGTRVRPTAKFSESSRDSDSSTSPPSCLIPRAILHSTGPLTREECMQPLPLPPQLAYRSPAMPSSRHEYSLSYSQSPDRHRWT